MLKGVWSFNELPRQSVSAMLGGEHTAFGNATIFSGRLARLDALIRCKVSALPRTRLAGGGGAGGTTAATSMYVSLESMGQYYTSSTDHRKDYAMDASASFVGCHRSKSLRSDGCPTLYLCMRLALSWPISAFFFFGAETGKATPVRPSA